jgi:hypothetical protein
MARVYPIRNGARVQVTKIAVLTDFSENAEIALRFAATMRKDHPFTAIGETGGRALNLFEIR